MLFPRWRHFIKWKLVLTPRRGHHQPREAQLSLAAETRSQAGECHQILLSCIKSWGSCELLINNINVFAASCCISTDEAHSLHSELHLLKAERWLHQTHLRVLPYSMYWILAGCEIWTGSTDDANVCIVTLPTARIQRLITASALMSANVIIDLQLLDAWPVLVSWWKIG